MRERLTRRTAAIVVVATLLLAAFAAPVLAADPVIEVQFLVDGDGGNGVLLVTGELPVDEPLPAVLRLPLPDGASVTWSGELTGGGPETDVARDFTVVEGQGGSYVEFTLKDSRIGQYDALYLPTTIVGDERQAVLAWVQASAATDLVFSVRMPAGAADVEIVPMPASGPATNDIGETLYILPALQPASGEQAVVEITYRAGSLLEDYRSGDGSSLIVILGVAVAVLVIALGLVVRSQARNRVPAELEE
jgi:hypothetical protein